MSLNENSTFIDFASAASHFIADYYLEAIHKLAPLDRGHPFVGRIPRRSDLVEGITAKIRFKTVRGGGWRPVARLGYTPTGAPPQTDEQEFTLKGHMATAQVTLEDIKKASGSNSFTRLMADSVEDLYETFPKYYQNAIFTPATGILGTVASVSTTTVTLDNAGLWNTHANDLNKRFEADMWIQFLTSAFAKRGDPVYVTDAPYQGATVVISSAVPGLADNDVVVPSDIAGLEVAYNQFGPGILDMIENDNTYQGVDRSAAGKAQFQAVVSGNSGTDRAVSYAVLSAFFKRMRDPMEAWTSWELIDAYFQNSFQPNIRFEDRGDFQDGFRRIKVANTWLTEDWDMFNDRVIVADFDNMFVADKGSVENLEGEGWKRIEGRPFWEYVVSYYMLLAATDCRNMGVLEDLDFSL